MLKIHTPLHLVASGGVEDQGRVGFRIFFDLILQISLRDFFLPETDHFLSCLLYVLRKTSSFMWRIYIWLFLD